MNKIINWIKEDKFRSLMLAFLTCLFVYLMVINQTTLLNSDKSIETARTEVVATPTSIAAEDQVVKIFHSPYCPHCHELNKFLESDLKDRYPTVTFEMHDITEKGETELFQEYLIMAGLDPNKLGTPTVFIGDD